MKYFYLLIALQLISSCLYAQFDYYIKDSITIAGVELIDGGELSNTKLCQVNINGKILQYCPTEVSEFGFSDKRKYKSLNIAINNIRYFFEVIAEGKINIYYLKLDQFTSKYYISNGFDSLLIEMPKDKAEYRKLIERYVDNCPESTNNIPYVKLKKNNLKRFVNNYNICSNKPIHRLRYGLFLGTTAIKLNSVVERNIYTIAKYNYKWNIELGGFIDIPIKSLGLSFHPEITYNKFEASIAFNDINYYNLTINYSSIKIPLLLRYTSLNNNISPYFKAGPVYSRALKNKGELIEYQVIQNKINTEIINSPILHKSMIGLKTSCGMIYKYSAKYSYFSEFNFTKLYNVKDEYNFFNLNEFSFLIGVLF